MDKGAAVTDQPGARILNVNDDEARRYSVTRVLQAAGYEVVEAGTGEEALRLAAHTRDLIILDVHLPDMTGFEVVRRLKSSPETSSIHVLHLSASSTDTDARVEGLESGADGYLAEPVESRELLATVKALLRVRRAEDQVQRHLARVEQANQELRNANEELASQRTRLQQVNAELERRRRGSELLAAVGSTLLSTIDLAAALQQVARLAVPELADWCTIDVIRPGESGWFSSAAAAHRDPAGEERVRELRCRYPLDPAAGYGAPRAVRTGSSALDRDVTLQDLESIARDAEHLRLLVELAPRSHLCLPLTARGRILGALTLVYADSGRHHSTDDVALAEELARRVGLAMDNARLYADLQEADRRKDEFLAMLAHELRNPLGPIVNAAEVLRLHGASDPNLARQREVIERQSRHMARLLDDLLDVSRITHGRIELRLSQLDLAAVVEQVVASCRPLVEERGHDLTIGLPSGGIWVEADAARLQQVVVNLLSNAAKYTPPGGTITLTAAAEEESVVLRVRDTGVGISSELVPQVFDLFTQAERTLSRSEGGLGIGLTMVKRLVEMHGGSVEARSDGPGRGSEFIVRLPAHEPGNRRQSPAQSDPPAGPRSPAAVRRVLIVEDNRDAAETLGELLRLWGHQVTIAASGEEALGVITSYLPELILIDIGLPGIDGYELACRLRGPGSRVPSPESRVPSPESRVPSLRPRKLISGPGTRDSACWWRLRATGRMNTASGPGRPASITI
jgi:signal transduction histidine kinase/DNA-binding response OmpR family regulator